jgi:uncharacterized protein (DUF2336 family)
MRRSDPVETDLATQRRTAQSAAQESLIEQLEQAIGNREMGRRVDVLRRITDLFVAGSNELDDEQVALFDEVMSRLATEVDSSARAAIGARLATIPNAPPRVSRMLALDDAIGVAGPVLAQSQRLDEQTLIEGARTKSQNHLLAISRRRLLSEGVTDILVERGNQDVVVSTAANAGANFSEFGYSTLVKRSQSNDELAVRVWLRREIPRQHLLTLFVAASEAVRNKLTAADRSKANLFLDLVRQASDRVQTEARESSAEYASAWSHVTALHEAGKLTETELCGLAQAGRFDETTVALSLMCDLPIGLVERALVHDDSDQILVLSKTIGLSWATTKAILSMQAGSAARIEQCFTNYHRLKPETAKTAIQFYRLRERAAKPTRN